MREARALLGDELFDSWRQTGTTLVVEHVREEPLQNGAPTSSVTVILSGCLGEDGSSGATAHSRGSAATVE